MDQNPPPESTDGIARRRPLMNRGPDDVLCLITGRPTPIPKRGPRSMYVDEVARDLHSRLSQVDRMTVETRDRHGFTPPAAARFRRLLSAVADVVAGKDLSVERRQRTPDRRPSIRIDVDLAARIDKLPGTGTRAAKVQALLAEALNERGV